MKITKLEDITYMSIEGDRVQRKIMDINGHRVRVIHRNNDKTALLYVDDVLTNEPLDNLLIAIEAQCS